MSVTAKNAKRLLTLIVLPALLLGVSGCASTSAPAWENVHTGHLIGNIYTGDDHI